MNAQTKNRQPTGRSRLTWLTFLCLLPIAIGVVTAVNYFVQRQLNASELATYLGNTRTDDAWLERRFRDSTSTEGTAAWSQIGLLCDESKGWNESHLPILGDGQVPTPLRKDTQWPEHEQVVAFLAEMQPVIQLIHDSVDVKKPVWQPIQFNGIATTLPHIQTSMSIGRLLHLEAVNAIYIGDSSRAMAAIKGLKATAEVFDWQLYLIGEIGQLRLRASHYQVIAQSLTANLWTDEQLAELTAMIDSPIDIAKRWSGALNAERTFLNSSPALVLPAADLLLDAKARLQLQRSYDEMIELGSVPFGQLSSSTYGWESGKNYRSYAVNIVRGSIFPAINAAAQNLERVEYQRRLTLTALAIKRFQLAQQRWPTDLSELSQVGVPQDVWNFSGPRFEMEVNEDHARVFPDWGMLDWGMLDTIEVW